MRRWWRVLRCVHMQRSRFSTSFPSLQLRRGPKPKPRPPKKNDSLKAVARPQEIPSKSIQPKKQHPSFAQEASALVTARWKGKKLPFRIATYGVLVYMSSVAILYYFFLSRVPITGRRRFSWQSESLLRKLDEEDRQLVEALRRNTEKGSVEITDPVLQMIKSVINRLVKAAGLEEMDWEVRVTKEPDFANACKLRSGLVVISAGFLGYIVQNKDEMAAALGHEIAHVLAGHSLESKCIGLTDKFVNKPLKFLAIASYIYKPAVVCGLPRILSLLISNALNKIRVREANYISLLLTTEAGFNPAGAVSLWTKYNEWEEERRRQSNSKLVWVRALLKSDHPYSALRIEETNRLIPDIDAILGAEPSATKQTVTQPEKLVARQRRWQEFVKKRDESRLPK